MCAVEDTPRAILDTAERWGSRLAIVGIATLTPLAAALVLDDADAASAAAEGQGDDAKQRGGVLRCVKRIYLQGNAACDAATDTMTPESQAYNFRCDMAAAEAVFAGLQRDVPFTLLGKFAAYQVGITKQELASLNRGFADGVRNHFGVFGEASWRRIAHARAKYVDLVVLTRPPTLVSAAHSLTRAR